MSDNEDNHSGEDAGDNEEEVTTKKPKGTKRKAKKKGPKRPLSAYMFFCAEKRAEVKAANPQMSFAELGKKLGSMWQELDEGSKKPYIKQNEKDKARYEKEKEDFPEEEGEESGKKKKTKGSKKKKDGPKPAKSAYLFFCEDERARLKKEDPSLGFQELGKKMGENWKGLSDEDKAPYVAKAKEAKEAAGGSAKAAKPKKSKKAAKEDDDGGDEEAAGGDDDADDGNADD